MKSNRSPEDNLAWASAASRLADELGRVDYDRFRLPDLERNKLETLAAKLSITLPAAGGWACMRDDRRSSEAKAYRRLYNTAGWKAARAQQLRDHPLCQCPHCQEGKIRVTAATVVDHRKPHKGDEALFFDPDNLTSMAKPCHDRFKQSEEKGGSGFNRGCDANGWPVQ